MTIFLTVLHVMACVVLVIVVLLQQGKGADIGAVFGGGGSNTVFGSRGAGNFLTRLTTGAALLFMVSSLTLSYIANTGATSSLFEDDAPPAGVLVPAPDAAPAVEPVAPGGFDEIPTTPAAPDETGGAPEAATGDPAAGAQAADAAPAAPGDPAPTGEAPATP